MNKHLVLILFLVLGLAACKNDDLNEIDTDPDPIETDIDTPDWTNTTHSKDADPNYAIVFPNDQVLRIDLTISSTDWTAMQSNLAANIGSNFGGPGGSEIDFDPLWVACSFKFNGIEWYKVGIRYKGNSSLRNAYNNDSDKFPFKIDFDEFEDTYPAIEDQRFYGFKQLNLSSNFSDGSFMREKVAADLFREFGVASAKTSFCEVYLDKGNGPEYIGLYTLVEEVDDTVAETQFDDEDGNLYKPEGTGSTFAQGTYNDEEMYKKSNEDEADYSDVKALYDVLHQANRTSNEEQWKMDIEAVFNVDRYLKYLAANTAMQNWDTYGKMTHNYFLYNDSGKLVWIPWDNNESLQTGKMGGALSLSLSEVGSDWPLIRYVMDVDAYEQQYRVYLGEFVQDVFETSRMTGLYSTYETLLSPYAIKENSGFSGSVSTLRSHVAQRNQAVDDFLE